MNICVIGVGYVGLTTSAVLADKGHRVHAVDINEEKISLLNEGIIPIYEPGLEEMILRSRQKGRLRFSVNVREAIKDNDIIYIAVGTPANDDGSTNLSYIQDVALAIADYITSYKIIITKSTVPPGTNEWINQTLIEKGIDQKLFDVVSNPEFLKEGSAIQDLLHPDKTVIGTKSERPVETVKSLYKGFHGEVIVTSLTGAELIKYASNAFLATKISFMNEMARICDAYNVNINDISKGIGTDPRIGPLFLNAGLGYGGSCFPKDVSSLYHSAKKKNISVPLLEATMTINNTQINEYLKKLKDVLGDFSNKKIAIWGLAFKPNTDDTRFSRAYALIDHLLEHGASIDVYDPIVSLTEKAVTVHESPYQAVRNSDALIVATEWDVFKAADWKRVKDLMNGTVLVDGRNMFEPTQMKELGFQYLGLGRPV